MAAFNTDSDPFTGNGTSNFQPDPNREEVSQYLVTVVVNAGSATVSVQQRGGAFTNLSALSLSAAGTAYAREVITASNRTTIDLVIASASSLDLDCYIEKLAFTTR